MKAENQQLLFQWKMNMMLHQQNDEKFAKEDCVQQKLMSEIRCLKKREVLLTYYKVNIQK